MSTVKKGREGGLRHLQHLALFYNFLLTLFNLSKLTYSVDRLHLRGGAVTLQR